MLRRVAKGFSLIELMIVVAVVAILASLAYYNYSRYAFRTRRADGREMLLRVAAAQERFYTNTNTYVISTGNLTADPPVGLGFSDALSAGGHYTMTVASGTCGTAHCYVLTAAPVDGDIQASDDCGALTYDNVGNKGWTGSHPPTNGSCW
jgi:type IV pilus assembly protein PilE